MFAFHPLTPLPTTTTYTRVPPHTLTHRAKNVISSHALYSRRYLAQKRVLMGYVSVFCGPASYLWPLSSLILPFSNYLSLLFLLSPLAAPWTIARRWSSEQERMRWLLSLSHSSLNEPWSVHVHMLHVCMDRFSGRRHRVVSAATSQQDGSGLKFVSRTFVELECSPCVCVGSFWVLLLFKVNWKLQIVNCFECTCSGTGPGCHPDFALLQLEKASEDPCP